MASPPDNLSGSFSAWRDRATRRFKLPGRRPFFALASVFLLALTFLLFKGSSPSISKIDHSSLTTAITIGSDDIPRFVETYRFEVDTSKKNPVFGIPRLFPRIDGVTFDELSATLNGKPYEVRCETFRDVIALLGDEAIEQTQQRDNIFELSYSVKGAVTSSGFERSFRLPLTNPRVAISLGAIAGSLNFLFDPSDGIAELPTVHVVVADETLSALSEVPVEKRGANFFTFDFPNTLLPSTSLVIETTWRHPTAQDGGNHA